MRLILDTHALLWWLSGDERLSLSAREAILDEGNTPLVSAVSAAEISLKHRIGKLPQAEWLVADFLGIVAGQGFGELPLSTRHGLVAGGLAATHKDPFDRMLIAQALVEGVPLISNERLFDGFGVTRIW